MATSGLTQFDLDIDSIINKAIKLAGGELSTAEDLKTAVTSLNLLLRDMENRGHPLAEIQIASFTATSAVASQTLGSDVIDLLSVTVTRSSVTTPLERIGWIDYTTIAVKDTEGLPSQFAVQKNANAPTLYYYPVSPNSTDVIEYVYITKIEDAGSNYTNTLDVLPKYLPAIVFGLAYFIGIERKIPIQDRQELKQNYIECLDAAETDDRERVGFRVTPYAY